MIASLVSIIMPAKDVGEYIAMAVQSVMEQSYQNWELIIIENGSNDNTGEIISTFEDKRIHSIRAEKTGLSHARNLGLKIAQGEFICFLDADDKLPTESLSSRVNYFQQNPEVIFLDGIVLSYNYSLTEVTREWVPNFSGIPQTEMALLAPRCFCGITWMIRRSVEMELSFDETWTHLEDRMFFLSIAHHGIYAWVNELIYIIRRRSGSLMANHDALELAYERFMDFVNERNLLTPTQKRAERKYFHKMFFKTYLKNFRVVRALRHFWNMI